MEIALKAGALAVLAAVLCLLLRQREAALAVGLSVLACAALLVVGIRFLKPVWEVLQRLESLSGLQDGITQPMIKVVGIGILTQISSGLCQDSGEAALGKTVEQIGTILSVYLSLPLLSSVLDMVEQLMGGVG